MYWESHITGVNLTLTLIQPQPRWGKPVLFFIKMNKMGLGDRTGQRNQKFKSNDFESSVVEWSGYNLDSLILVRNSNSIQINIDDSIFYFFIECTMKNSLLTGLPSLAGRQVVSIKRCIDPAIR